MYLASDTEADEPDGKRLVHFTGPDCQAQHAAWNEKRQLEQVI